jgi:glycogen debranching enzyme
MYTSLNRQAEWWMTHRRRDGDQLPYYLHGNDSGWDNSTMFQQGVPLIAPDLAALLVLQMEVLADLAGQVGEPDAAEDWATRANALLAALLEELWRGDHFVARYATTGADVESQSLIPWLPIILGERLPVEMRECLRDGVANHLTEWGLATEHVDSPKYQSDGYWQGPIWAPSTYIAVTGLDRCGFTELADEVSNRFCRLCGKSGFAENFDAVSGAPLCDKAYTWTASVFLLLAERMKVRESGGDLS